MGCTDFGTRRRKMVVRGSRNPSVFRTNNWQMHRLCQVVVFMRYLVIETNVSPHFFERRMHEYLQFCFSNDGKRAIYSELL